MKIYSRLLTLALLVTLISSCEKVIDIPLKNSAPQLIIEGNITNVAVSPTVNISRSVKFTDPNSFPGVSGAVVKISSSSGSVFNLTETSPGKYTYPPLIGRPGRTYTLQVDVDGKTYKAVSIMPNPVLLDSVSIDEQSFGKEITKNMVVYYTDPPDVKNQYRFILYVNGTQVKNVFARNDLFNDDSVVRVVLYQDDIKLKAGDRVDIDMECIDPQIYTYWFTFSKQDGNGMGNASTAPTNPPNNFDSEVLGYFSAHTLQRKSAIVR